MNDGLVEEQDILNCLMGIRGGVSFQLYEIHEHRHNIFCVLFYFWQECWRCARNKHRFESVLDGTRQAREEMYNGNYRPTLVLIREVIALLEELGLRKTFEKVIFVDMIDIETRLDQAVAQQESPVPT